MASQDVLAAADRNMVEAWRALLRRAPRPLERVIDGAHLLSSGLPVAMVNPAYALEPTGRNPAALVDEVRDHYGSVGLPFALYFRDDVTPELADACAAAGMVEHWQVPLMVLDPIPTIPEPPAGLRVERLDAANADVYASVIAAGFGAPHELAVALFGRGLAAATEFVGLLGYLDGEPVATSAVFVGAGVAGVYNVATVPSARGRGVGAAMTWAAVAAGAEAGATASILQASEAGQPVYERMGYGVPARYRQFEPRPS